MKKEELNMDKKFRDKLEGFSAEPPSHVWDNIQRQLASKRKNRRLVLLRWIAAAAVVLLAFLAGWYFNEKSDKVIPSRVENKLAPIEKIMPQPENNVTKQQQNDQNKQDNKITGNEVTTESVFSVANKTEQAVRAATKSETVTTMPENVQKEHAGELLFQKIKMSFLDSKLASLSVRLPKVSLKQKEETQEDLLSESEKLLVAENVKQYSESAERKGNWKMGLEVSPGYASQVASYTDSYAQDMTYSGSDGSNNVGGGLSVQYKTGKKWSIESGIYYAQNGQRSSNTPEADYYDSVAGSAFDTEKSYFNTAVNLVNGQLAMNSTAGVIEFSGTPKGAELATIVEDSYSGSNTLITSSEFSQVFDFLEIPLYVRYDIIDAKFGLQIMGGINAGIVTGNNVYMESQYGTQNVGKTKDISTLNLSGTLGLGLSYDLSKHISMAIEPRLNYYLNSINNNPDVDFRPYRIGFYTGVYYQF